MSKYKIILFIALIGIINAQTSSPCNDELFISLKKKDINEMTDREYEYLIIYDKMCQEDRMASKEIKNENIPKIDSVNKGRSTSVNRWAFFKGSVRVGFDINGNMNSKYNSTEIIDEKTGIGFSGALESAYWGNEDLRIGLGVEYQLKRDIKDEYDGKFSFTSTYGLAAIRVDNQIYLIGRYGYSSYDGDSDYTSEAFGGSLYNGIYYSFGAWILFNPNFGIELSYSNNTGQYPFYDFDLGTFELDDTYSRITISIISGMN